jgi:ribulose-5-phosphate 4-epimerase/fuculose-1-phosphate aldolase
MPDGTEALPPLTAYFAMRVGRLLLLPYFAPGNEALVPVVESAALQGSALLLRNHGPIVAGRDLAEALDVIEEIEQTARLYLLLGDRAVRPLSEEQRQALTGPSMHGTP